VEVSFADPRSCPASSRQRHFLQCIATLSPKELARGWRREQRLVEGLPGRVSEPVPRDESRIHVAPPAGINTRILDGDWFTARSRSSSHRGRDSHSALRRERARNRMHRQHYAAAPSPDESTRPIHRRRWPRQESSSGGWITTSRTPAGISNKEERTEKALCWNYAAAGNWARREGADQDRCTHSANAGARDGLNACRSRAHLLLIQPPGTKRPISH